ncbi:aminotransferase class V-fold PLP-dependent enzyme [Mycetocola saprophilus]|uniref:aminotransferase class V-fold PLP-dependent enzyme n=1 Tax=Mycetocola saprophilus TaxID=76636 RepID=UPI003BF3F8D2
MNLPLLSPFTLADGTPARAAWAFAPGVVPLNHGSFGAVASPVIAAQRELQRTAELSAVGWFPFAAERTRLAREAVAGFVGASPADTVFVPNASAGATVVLNALRLAAGDEILVTDHGYSAVLMGVRRLARRTGARVTIVPIALEADDQEILATFTAAITPRTRLIVVDQISSATAKVFPTAALTTLAHAHGVRVLVDGAHAPGLVADAARVAGADWWFGNLHKWPAAPRGSALLVTAAEDRDDLWPLIDSWNAELPYPERFDMQGTLDITSYLASPIAVDFIEHTFGWDRARAAMTTGVEAAAAQVAAALAPHVAGPTRPEVAGPAPAMRLIRLPGTLGSTREEADGLRERLFAATGIESAFTSFRGIGYVRLSVHLYTVQADIDAFINRAIPPLVEWSREG